MDRILLDLKKKLDEKEIALLSAIRGFKELPPMLEAFRKKKRFTIMLRGKKKDGMKATETFDNECAEILLIRDFIYGELKALTESVKGLFQIIDFLDKEYLDDAALFLSSTLHAEKTRAEMLNRYAEALKSFQEDLKALGCNKELEEQTHLCIKGLYEYMRVCLENVKILDLLIERIDFFRKNK